LVVSSSVMEAADKEVANTVVGSSVAFTMSSEDAVVPV